MLCLRGKDKMLRVLIFGMHDKLGGVETYLMNYYRFIDRDKIQFDFINMYEKLCFEDEIKNLGGKIYNIENVKKNPIKYAIQLKNIIQKGHYKVVHINMLSAANILPILISKLLNVNRIIVHSHSSNIPVGYIKKLLHVINKKIVTTYATDFLACSKLAGKWLFSNRVKFKIVNNALDTKKFLFDSNIRKYIRNNMNLNDKFVLGHIGRFEITKNHKFVIDVFNEICKIDKNCILILIGDGELLDNIKQKVNNLNLNKNIIFLGVRTDINILYQAMDIFILPSLFEGLPISGIEAQASGLKCFFSNKISKESDITGLVKYLPLKSPKCWANIILKYKNGYKRGNMEQKVLQSGYDIEDASKRLERFYLKTKL